MTTHVVHIRQTTASDGLTRVLLDLAAAGLCPPCGEQNGHELWTSDDPEDRSIAVDRCQVCPALRPCDEAATENDERHHVWGGVDRTRKQRKATHA